MLDNFMDKPFEEQSVNQISDDLFEIAYDQPFRFPATFTFVMRAFSTLEGVGKGLDPEFNFMEIAQPFALKVMNEFNGKNGNSLSNTILDELGKQAAQVSNTAFNLPRRLENTIDQLERGDIRLRVRNVESDRLLRRLSGMQMATNYSLFISAFVISATLLLVNGYIEIAIIVTIIAIFPAIALFRLLKRLDKFDQKF
jgi:predicted unusual protein kinase regulating ubiquinone biosynthesis (AarF/ABC1/UbiB family)